MLHLLKQNSCNKTDICMYRDLSERSRTSGIVEITFQMAWDYCNDISFVPNHLREYSLPLARSEVRPGWGASGQILTSCVKMLCTLSTSHARNRLIELVKFEVLFRLWISRRTFSEWLFTGGLRSAMMCMGHTYRSLAFKRWTLYKYVRFNLTHKTDHWLSCFIHFFVNPHAPNLMSQEYVRSKSTLSGLLRPPPARWVNRSFYCESAIYEVIRLITV